MEPERIHIDEDGKCWLKDNDGKIVTDEFGNKVPTSQTIKKSVSSGFTTYDTSQGHCTFCGRLSCNGGCFK